MPSTTTLGYPIPVDTDPVSDGALAIRNLASAIDTKLGVMAAGQNSVTLTAAASGTTAVTFPASRFAAAPIVTATVAGGSATYVAGVGSVTASGFTLIAFHRDGTASSLTLPCAWIARTAG